MSLLSMIRGLTEAKVDFVVVGGVAARAHGSPRITEDLDICYDPTPANRDRLAAVLARWHAYPRGIEPGLPFIMDAKTLENAPVLTLTTDEGALDLFDGIAGVGGFAKVKEASVPVTGDVRFLALGLPALLEAKRATGRPKDLDQLPELEALLALRRRQRRK